MLLKIFNTYVHIDSFVRRSIIAMNIAERYSKLNIMDD